MDWTVVAGLLGFLLLCLLSGMRIAFCMAAVGILTLYLEGGTEAFGDLGFACWNSVNSFVLLAVPLFILMGNIIIHSGLAERLYSDLTAWLYKFPGRLLVSNIVSCSVFAAICGSTLATAATIGQVAIPVQRAKGYKPRYIYGSLAAGGTLGILIPPSINMIVYGSITGTSVAKLFIAGFIPGAVLTALFVLFIVIYSKVRANMAPPTVEFYSWHDRFRGFRTLIPVGILVAAVMGSIYTGVATPTEAAAVGVCGAFAITAAYKRLSRAVLMDSFMSTVETSAWLFFLVIGANILGYAFGRAGITQQVAQGITGLEVGPMGILIMIMLMYVGLGCIIDPISMLLLTMPIVYPVLQIIGCDLLWFGILYILLSETGNITPPVGLNLFVIQGIAKAPIGEVIVGVIPYIIILFIMIGLITIFPIMALWLPQFMAF